jgi:non-specific serine/threonine protein kinase
MLSLILTPHGRLLLEAVADSEAPLAPELAHRLTKAFQAGDGHGLVQLGASEVQTVMPPVFSYWREFAARYVVAVRTLCSVEQSRALPPIPPPASAELDPLVLASPAMKGAEYLSAPLLETLWAGLDAAFRLELEDSKASLEDFLKQKNPAWNLIGRVHFNLAENRKDDEFPFAFLVTYTHRLSSKAKAQHVPLGRALTEYGGAANKSRLLSLLLPVQRASEKCEWLRAMVDTAEIYHPLRWSPSEALQLLNDMPLLESAGVIVRVPGTWRSTRPLRPKVSAKVGDKPPSEVGVEAMLDFSVEVSLDGEALTEDEIARLLAGSNGLHFVRGRWVEVDRDKLAKLIERFRAAEKTAGDKGLTFGYAMRLVAGAEAPGDGILDQETLAWSRVSAGDWLSKTLEDIRHPANLARITTGSELHTTLRSVHTRRQAFNGSISCPPSASAPALRMTWVWAKRCRSSLFW